MNKTKIIDCDFLIAHWDFEKNQNQNFDPYKMYVSSTKTAFFRCEKNHEYTYQINSKFLKKIGCPVCSNKRVIRGINDFESNYPELAKQWDYEKNGVIKPYEISKEAQKSFYWICKNGHSFKSKVYRMVKSLKGLNCPYCRGQEVLEGFNDLQTKNPNLALEWNYEKNNGIKPTQVVAGSPKKYWWKCNKCNGEWEASLASRNADKVGCPYCTHQKVIKGITDFATTHNHLLKYWDYEKNTKYKPDEVFAKSPNKKIWWKCDKDHSFNMVIGHFAEGERCPYCSNKRILEGYNDLKTTNPKLALEWNYQKNKPLLPEQIFSGTPKKYWWKCEKGHEWQASVSSRNTGRGCPECTKERRTSLPEKVIFYYVKKYFDDAIENYTTIFLGKREFDIFVPSLNLAIEYDGESWHNDVENDLKKDNICEENNLKIVRFRELGCPKYESTAYMLYCVNPHSNLNKLSPYIEQLFALINDMFDVSIKALIDIENDYDEILQNFSISIKSKSLEALSPNIAKQWHPTKNGDLKPNQVSNNTQKSVWWLCYNGHSWKASVGSRTRKGRKNTGCPYCSNKKVLEGFNDLQTKFPEIARQYDKIKNKLPPSKILYSSLTKRWWICENGHSWETSVAIRTIKGHGCPYCSNLYTWPGFNDLQTKFPEIAKDWNYVKNGDLLPSQIGPGSHKKVWWICENGHEWQAIPYSRTKQKTNCPICYKKSKKIRM